MKLGTRILLFSLLFLAGSGVYAQQMATIYGVVTDANNQPVELANVSVIGFAGGVSTSSDGSYELEVPSNTELIVVISFIGYQDYRAMVNLKAGSRKEMNAVMQSKTTELPTVEIKDQAIRKTTLQRIDPKTSKVLPTISGGIEDLLTTLPGVASNNELSSQYSVRGGNFDENLVYVNGIEIYRPFLIRSGQQEGLSFVNSDLVSSILFSAGGFETKYGDKMSSVLDIQYKKPTGFGGSFSASLLGASGHLEGASDNERFRFLIGVRHKTNQYLLKGLETKGDYKPSFTDVQTLLSYDITEELEISFLGNFSKNKYEFEPQNRTTKFGTISEAYQLRIYFDGKELDQYKTMMGALSLNYKPAENSNFQFIFSAFNSDESETFDIQGQYWLGRLETGFGSEEFGEVVQAQGVGTYLIHARNFIDATVFNVEHKGNFNYGKHGLSYGVKLQREIIEDYMSEWELLDSAGFSIPNPPPTIGQTDPLKTPLYLNEAVRASASLNTNRYNAFIQDNIVFGNGFEEFSINGGVRFSYWDYNKEFLVSPRLVLSYQPDWERDIVFRFATGVYYQPPFFREMRNFQGELNPDIKAQQSIHFVFGSDWDLDIWSRPFKFTTEVYYKQLNNLIPYEIDNVRIRYHATNNAKGYATGIDLKINGEFVKGIESWASLSLMKTEEDILDDYYYDYYNEGGELIVPGFTIDDTPADSTRFEPGFIPRPTDQRLNFALFFQDYLPRNPTYKMHLKLVYGTGLPIGPPKSPKYKHTLRLPPYRRVDIGFSKQIVGENSEFSAKNPLKYLNSMWISLEVFNLLQVNNTISYLWVKDVNNRQYAVPNYLTPRQLNLRLVVQF